MTQTVWGDDICPVRIDQEKEREAENNNKKKHRRARASESSGAKILCYK